VNANMTASTPTAGVEQGGGASGRWRQPGGPRRGRSRTIGAWLGASSLLALGLVGASAADAAHFGVRVVDGGGQPVSGASVCIGLEGNYSQFGASFTDIDGNAGPVEVPNVPFVLTISKTRFAGLRLEQPGRDFDLVREVTLPSGAPGPRCKAGSSVVANPPAIDVRGVDVAAGSGPTTLTPNVSGEPSHYRVARDESFAGAPWRRFEQVIALPEGLAGEPAVYLQMRRYTGNAQAWLEARSNIVAVEIPSGESPEEEGATARRL